MFDLMQFNKGKCKVLSLGRSNPLSQYTLGGDQLEGRSAEEDLGGVFVNKKLTVNQECSRVTRRAKSL